MAASSPLHGTDLVDCARANAREGIEVAANLCGYGQDLTTFSQELKQACQDMGIQIDELSDLMADQQQSGLSQGIDAGLDLPLNP
ncbi:hypothetical protein [Leptolyngbya sp. FACHB-261]|uniref:hypothetical protein n=1 Tax=Leptolyngbya sp. FACHB-261 TaxID=2692806 RepID=UPI001686571F|nr:hypothetical protein [Leptolyngbya sp. FACHB-261]MBD2102710.1 hypothetical protein [Leptolyngbya sp. FACHB-261]